MIRPDNPLRPYLDPSSIERWERQNAVERDNAGETQEMQETRGDSGDWLVRLIERKLRQAGDMNRR